MWFALAVAGVSGVLMAYWRPHFSDKTEAHWKRFYTAGSIFIGAVILAGWMALFSTLTGPKS